MRHPSDTDLLLHATHESTLDCALHIEACGRCRSRLAELTARLSRVESASLSMPDEPRRLVPQRSWVVALTSVLAGALIVLWISSGTATLTDRPDPARTPGAVDRAVTVAAVCAATEESGPSIAPARAMVVFQRYGISRPEPRKYEVDYLIPPELGGTSDPDNLWPQPYSNGEWNARVKDALEDRLRAMVCNREIDLATAQHELVRDWIGAYRKYFHTDRPLTDHAGFVKDRPWE